MNVTREMLGAAHDILLKKEIVLSADIISNIYIAMANRDAEIAELVAALEYYAKEDERNAYLYPPEIAKSVLAKVRKP